MAMTFASFGSSYQLVQLRFSHCAAQPGSTEPKRARLYAARSRWVAD
jgi:hypothetical protein